MNKYRIIFEKTGRAVYISHLDLMRTFQRAFQRAGVPIKHTEGFNPHAHISIALPLPVGMESICEILDFESPEILDADFISKLNSVMPEGIKAANLTQNTRKTGDIAWLECELKLIYDHGVKPGTEEKIKALFDSASVIIKKKSKKGPVDFDIIPCIKSLKINRNGDNLILGAVIAAQNPSVNPMLISDAIAFYIPDFAPNFTKCNRLRLFDKDFNEFK